jgi:hypothetical protein
MRSFPPLLAAFAAALAIAAVPAGAQSDPPPGVAELQALVDQSRAYMMRPGERVAGWDRGGANPDADLRALGADSHYMLNRDPDGDSVTIISTRPIRDFAPASWRVVDSYGDAATPLPGPQLDFEAMSARYVVATRTQYRRRGDVDCTSGITNALLFERPGAPASADDDLVPLGFRILLLAAEGQELCVRSDGDVAHGYTQRTFLPDGRLLPELSRDQGVSVIVAAAPLDRLLTRRSPPPAAPDPAPQR